MSNSRHNRSTVGNILLKTTAFAAIGLSALFGGNKLHEGIADLHTPAMVEVASNGDPYQNAGNALEANMHHAMNTVTDLSLGVGGLCVAGLILLAGVTHAASRRHRVESNIDILDSDEPYYPTVYSDAVEAVDYEPRPAARRTTSVAAEPAPGYAPLATESLMPLDPVALGWDERRPAMV